MLPMFAQLILRYPPPRFASNEQTSFSWWSNEVANELSALSSSLSPCEKIILLTTLLRYADVFEHSLGHTNVVRHNIDTGDSPPIRQRPRRLRYAYRKETDDQIRNMLDQGVIHPSISPWASPIILVQEKGGKYCFCVD